jgi:hypothetical protein
VTRYLVLTFEVREDCTLSDAALELLGDEIVTYQIAPDPPVLLFDGVEVRSKP